MLIFKKLLAVALCLCCPISGYSQSQWTGADVLRIVHQQWQQLGNCLEVKLSLKKNGSFDGTEYGFEPISGSSSGLESTWFFSGNNYHKTDMILNVRSGEFYANDQAVLNGDVETLAYGPDGPRTLNLHHPRSEAAIMSELPFLQMFHSGLRGDVERLLLKSTVETGMLDQEKAVIATTVVQKVIWKYYFSTDKIRLLRVTSKTESGMGGECNFTYRDNATSWFDLAKCTSATLTPHSILTSSSYEIHEIIQHASLPDDTFRVARPANVRVVDHQEKQRREKLGETTNMVEMAPSVPPKRQLHLGYWLIATAVVVAGVLLIWRQKSNS